MDICDEDIEMFESDFKDCTSLTELYSLAEKDVYWGGLRRPELYNILIKTKKLKDRLLSTTSVSSRVYTNIQVNYILSKIKEESVEENISYDKENIILKLINSKKPLYSFSKDNGFDIKDVISMRKKIDIVLSKYRKEIEKNGSCKENIVRKHDVTKRKKKTQYQIVAERLHTEGIPITFMTIMDDYYRVFNRFQYHNIVKKDMIKNKEKYPVTDYEKTVPDVLVEYVSSLIIENGDDITYEYIVSKINENFNNKYHKIGYFTIYLILKNLYRNDLIEKFFGDMWFGR